MGSSRGARFGDLFRGLSPAERRRFLADLWDARGWETTAEGDVVVARRDDDRRRIAVADRRRFGAWGAPPDDADVVVSLGGRLAGPDARVFTTDELYEFTRYGFPDDAGEELLRRHFGDELDAPADESGREIRRSRPVAVVLVAVLVLAALALSGALPVPGLAPPSATDSTATPTTEPVASPTPEPEPQVLAPGVTSAGVENVSRLAAAHRAVLDDRSYRWTIGYRESIAGDETGRVVEVVCVEEPHVYVTNLRRSGSLRAFPRPTSTEVSYADGTFRYTRRPAEPDGYAARVIDPDVVAGQGRQATRAGRYVEWYLTTERSEVVARTEDDGTRVYEVVGRGSDFPRSRQYEVVAVVEETGFVRSVRVTYETQDGLDVTVWFEYDRLDETSVGPPAWLDQGTRETPVP